MGSRLRHINNWEEVGHCSGYNAHEMARLCEVSLRQLERFLQDAHGTTPHHFLRQMRMKRALELICDKTSVKATALSLGYKTASHFSTDFKTFYGSTPSQYPGSPGSTPHLMTATVKNEHDK